MKFLFELLGREIQSEQIACDLIIVQQKCGDERNWQYIMGEWEFKGRGAATTRTILFRAIEYGMEQLHGTINIIFKS